MWTWTNWIISSIATLMRLLIESEGEKLKTALHALADGLGRKRSTEKTKALCRGMHCPWTSRIPANPLARDMVALAPRRLPAPTARRLDGGAVGGAQDRAELWTGQSDLLSTQSLDEANAFPAASRGLSNNIVERALKKAILNRKNSLFDKTLNGARVGDLFMSLIQTCELNGANPFDYLTELLRHAEAK